MARLTFIGTGLIGEGLASAALKRGHDVTVWNRSPEKTAALKEAGATVAGDVAAAMSGQDRVHIALSDEHAVAAVLERAGEALKGALLIDHTTASPKGTLDNAAAFTARGARYLHAPVFMSPAMCHQAKGMMLAAGPSTTWEAAQEGLEEMTGAVRYLGERMDAAAAYKLFGNAMIITLTAGLSDVYAMAASLGIEAEDARAFFDVFNPVGVIAGRGKKMAAGDYRPSFELPMARKDVRLMIESTKPAHPLCVLPGIAARMDALLAKGEHDHDDFSVIAVDAVPKAST